MREDYSTMALAGPSAPGGENLGVDDEGFGDMLSFDRNETGPADLLRDASAADQVIFLALFSFFFLVQSWDFIYLLFIVKIINNILFLGQLALQ